MDGDKLMLEEYARAAVEMILLSGNVQELLQDMKKCLHMMELSEAIKPEDTRVGDMMAALRKRIDEIEHVVPHN